MGFLRTCMKKNRFTLHSGAFDGMHVAHELGRVQREKARQVGHKNLPVARTAGVTSKTNFSVTGHGRADYVLQRLRNFKALGEGYPTLVMGASD